MAKMNKSTKSIIFGSIILMLILMSTISSYALDDKKIKWSGGNTYKLTLNNNMATEKEYTIKVIDFPPPVRGEATINGGRRPERPVVPFVRLELYKDIINNPNPIETFGIGIGDDYITSDQELRITIDSIPGDMSQDWVYEYYNPWVVIRTQKRFAPNLDIQINLKDESGGSIDENKIGSGDNIKAEIKIKNSGNDVMKDISFNVYPDPLLLKNVMITNTLKDVIGSLNEGEERIIDVHIMIPTYLEKREYNIKVDVTGKDVKDIIYDFSTSKIIKVEGDIESIYVEKYVTRNTTYLKQYDRVVLNVVNTGHLTVSNIRIDDAIPDRLIFIKDGVIYSHTRFSFNKSSIGPSESWTIEYDIKPVEPGIYILPKFNANFSAGGKPLSATSGEVGFRVFGPKVVLTKSATDMGNGIVEVIVKAKNMGNGFTRVVIEDKIPDNTVLVSGKTSLITSLDPDVEKTMSYTIQSSDVNISNLIWLPARADYYLDDWKFNTSSDEKYEEGHIVKEERPLEGGIKTHIVIIKPTATQTIYPMVSPPKMEETKKKVVAVIPKKTPTKTPEKSIPGFISYESLFSIFMIIILSGVLPKNKKRKINKINTKKY